jgi:hypothetical protein
MADTAKKSPLKAPPLRVAGESLDAQLDEHIRDELLTPYLLAGFLAVFALLEWYRHFTGMPPSPWLFTGGAAVAGVYATLRIRRGLRRAREIKQGRSGERAVAQYLEGFRTRGFFVFHDVPTGDANIDHVLIGAQGLFTIETKTLSKPVRGDARIRIRDEKIFADGSEISRNPLVQAKAQARWLANFIAETGFSGRVQPAIVFPGWFVEPCDMRALGVWVLEPKALDKFIEREPEVLSPDAVRALASALSSHIRAQSSL